MILNVLLILIVVFIFTRAITLTVFEIRIKHAFQENRTDILQKLQKDINTNILLFIFCARKKFTQDIEHARRIIWTRTYFELNLHNIMQKAHNSWLNRCNEIEDDDGEEYDV